MKSMISLCIFVISAFIWTGDSYARASPPVKGEVLEIMDVPGYTYLRLKTRDGETWAAIMTAQVEKGSEITITNATAMSDFKSKTLNRTFPTILFGTLASSAKEKAMGAHAGSMPLLPSANIEDITVAKATGANAKTVAEIITHCSELKDKPVLVSGKVVKFNAAIMGKNWVHLRDGTGSEAEKTNDILVTTEGETNVGDIVTVKGTVHTDRDFGSGYSYKVLIEEATLQK